MPNNKLDNLPNNQPDNQPQITDSTNPTNRQNINADNNSSVSNVVQAQSIINSTIIINPINDQIAPIPNTSQTTQHQTNQNTQNNNQPNQPINQTEITQTNEPFLKQKTQLKKVPQQQKNDSYKLPPFIYPYSSTFFNERMSQAFPGIRGFEWFYDLETIFNRLSILLKNPLTYYETNPIWWWRGNRHMYIEKFKILDQSKCLIDKQELLIHKMGVYKSNSYNRNFIYIETMAEKPIGIYNHTPKDIKDQINFFGFAYEEYAIVKKYNHVISTNEYDDGACIINGKPKDIRGRGQLRIRYLSKYNFIITAQRSPINNTMLNEYVYNTLNETLTNSDSIKGIIEVIEQQYIDSQLP